MSLTYILCWICVCILNLDSTSVLEALQVWFQRQSVMQRLDIGRQNLAALCDVHCSFRGSIRSKRMSAHVVALVATASNLRA